MDVKIGHMIHPDNLVPEVITLGHGKGQIVHE